MHCTFQYGANPGKRNRMREAMIFEDEPEYYTGEGGGWGLANGREYRTVCGDRIISWVACSAHITYRRRRVCMHVWAAGERV